MLTQFLIRLANIIIDCLLGLFIGLFVIGFCFAIIGSLMKFYAGFPATHVIAELFTFTTWLISIVCFISGLYKCRVYFFGNIKNPIFMQSFLGSVIESFFGSARSRRQLIIAFIYIIIGIVLLFLPIIFLPTSRPYG